MPPDETRHLKAMFRELSGSQAAVAHENALLVEWARSGGGLPEGGLRR